MGIEPGAAAGLWLAVFLSGLYHGLNPGMGWPLAVSAGLMGSGRRDLLRALPLLGAGHLAAMLLVLLPFALLTGLLDWQREIRLGASLLLIGAGVYLLIQRRHPRALARIAPHRLMLWSFAIAMAHGAGLMLVPVYLGICSVADIAPGHEAAGQLLTYGVAAAVGVALAHTAAMIAAGGAAAVLVHDRLGLGFLTRSWFNLDAVWAASLILVGALSLWAMI